MKYLYLAVLLFFFSSSFAQVTKRNLLTKKYTEADIRNSLLKKDIWHPFPKTPQEWREKVADTLIKKYIAAGESSLKSEFESIPATVALEYVRTGNRTHYQDISFRKRNLLWNLVLAESMEGKGRFTDQIINGIWSICEETFWGVPAHLSIQKKGRGLPDVEDPIVDLFAGETAGILSLTDYLVGDAIDKVSHLARQRITVEVNRRVFEPMIRSNYSYLGKGNPDKVLNNWAPWVMSNFLCATYFLEKDEDKRVRNTLFAMKYIDQYINGLGDDGACDEGPGYWFAAGGAVFDCLTFLADASDDKVSVYNDPFIQKVASYIYKVHIDGNYFINNADAPARINPDGVVIYRFGKAVNDEKMMAFGAWDFRKDNQEFAFPSRKFTGLYNLLALNDCKSFTKPYKDDTDVWFPDIQLMSSRSSNGLFVASHGGHNAEGHNHNDVGDFIVYADGEPVVIDVGAGTYTARTFSKERYNLWFNTSAFHNLPTFNGIRQSGGKSFNATDVSYATNLKSSSLSLNIVKAYSVDAGVKSWIRKVTMDKKGKIVISDSYSLTKFPDTLTLSLMTICETDLSQPGKIIFSLSTGKEVILDYDAKLWSASKQKVELKTAEDQSFKGWGKPIWRILLANKAISKNGQSFLTFHK